MPLHSPSSSLRRNLLLGILVPVLLFVVIDTISLYRQALGAVNVAYDRTLLASAKAIGELLDVEGDGPQARFTAHIPYSALEAFEADDRIQMVYRVSDMQGQWIDGAKDLPAWKGSLPDLGAYAALVDFYDTEYADMPVRVAILLQPVSSAGGKGMAAVQVAETLELRKTLARQILVDTLQRQTILISVITLVVFLVVQRVTRPVRRLTEQLGQRSEDDLTPIDAPDLPAEIQPLAAATNQFMQRLQHMLDYQKRFVRDAAHQLRTPLAVLKVQVQSAQRGDVDPLTALREIHHTVDRATLLANQMLSLAKVEQLRQQQDFSPIDWADVVRAVALDLAPLIADKSLDFELDTQSCIVMGHDWILRELVRNLLQNAIRHTPPHTSLQIGLHAKGGEAVLTIQDSGPGIADDLRHRLFQPFSAGNSRSGSGLGLTIAQEIAHALHGNIQLINVQNGQHTVVGLVARVELPLHST